MTTLPWCCETSGFGCTPIAYGAAQLIYAGACEDAAPELLQRALDEGRGATLYLVGQLAKRVWGNEAGDILLERLAKPLASGCNHVFAVLAELGSPHQREQLIESMFAALDGDDAKIAVGVAQVLSTLDPQLEAVHAERLQCAYDRWLEIEGV